MARGQSDASVHPSWNEYPELFAELDLSNNKGLTLRGRPIKAFELTCGTNKKLDWKCSECNHEWRAACSDRVVGNGCPACANRAIHVDGRNSMANSHPELAIEYQGDATKIIASTHKKLDWKCSECEHEWITTGSRRTHRGVGCPACVNQAIHVDGRNSMANTHPELAIEYQGDATKIIAGTHKKLDWKCSECEHEWITTGDKRTHRGQGCPACVNLAIHVDGRNSMAKTHLELAIEYQGDATKIIAGTKKRLEWKCSECDHKWRASGDDRVFGNGCPACHGSLHSDGRNSMANTHPELANEYQGDAAKIIAGTKKRLEWKCSDCEHEWKASGSSRVKGNGCSACQGSLHSDGRNSMANTHPELANEYQGDAAKIIAGTKKRLEWKCSDCEHEWITTGSKRTHAGQGCPACSKSGYDPSIIGYVYINRYLDSNNIWLKCGISNKPSDRINRLKQSAKEFNIDVSELEIYKFDDGFNAQLCESELLSMKVLRFDSGYDVEGKSEFFKFEALDEIKKIINNWL